MAEDEFQAHKDDGYLTMALLIDGYQGAVNGYVDYYGLTFPVLNDASYETSVAMGAGGATVPFYVLLGRDMTVLYSGGSPPTQSILQEALDEPWPEDATWPQQPTPEQIEEQADGQSFNGDNPFLADPAEMYETANTCSTSPHGQGHGAAALVLAGLLLVSLRRLRSR